MDREPVRYPDADLELTELKTRRGRYQAAGDAEHVALLDERIASLRRRIRSDQLAVLRHSIGELTQRRDQLSATIAQLKDQLHDLEQRR